MDQSDPPRDLPTFTEKYRGLITTLGLFTALLAFSTNPQLTDDPLLRLLLPGALLMATGCLWVEMFLRVPVGETSYLFGYFVFSAFFTLVLLTHQFFNVVSRAPVEVFGVVLPIFQVVAIGLVAVIVGVSVAAAPVWLWLRGRWVRGRIMGLMIMAVVLLLGHLLLSIIPREPFGPASGPTDQVTSRTAP